MFARIRLRVPDRPGSLGRVASAIGAASGDIAGVDVLESAGAQALDDVVVRVRDSTHLGHVLRGLDDVPGVEVVGVHHPAPPMPGHADLQLVAQVLARPERSLQTLVDGAPVALGVDWAAIVHADDVPEVGGVPHPDDDVVERLGARALEDVDAGDVPGGGADGGGDASQRAGSVRHPKSDPGEHATASPRPVGLVAATVPAHVDAIMTPRRSRRVSHR